MQGPSQGLPSEPGPAGQDGDRAGGPAIGVIITVATVLALVLRVYRLTHPGLLVVSQYDDGAYFGSAVRLVHGARHHLADEPGRAAVLP